MAYNSNYGSYNPARSSGPGWGLIVVLLIFFWPVGLFLLLKKLDNDRVARLKDGKTLRIAGIVLAAAGAFSLVMSGLYWYRAAGSSFFYIAGGCVLYYMGNKMKQTSHRYRNYITIVVNQGINDIEVIAGMNGVDYNTCMKDLQTMIDRGFFHDAYIDMGRRAIVLAPLHVQEPAMAGVPMAASGPRVKQCQGCGANNTVMGGMAECEYCGSPLY